MNSIKKVSGGILYLVIIFLFLTSFQVNEQEKTKRIIEKMFQSIDQIRSLQFRLKKKERVNGEILSGEQEVKFIRNPKKIYTKIIAPNEGAEVLFIEGKNNNHAYINPNAFPFITLSLDPYGSIMRKNNHHTVHEVGFDYINSIVKFIANKSGENFGKYFIYDGDTIFNNRKCHKILIDYLPFKYVNYTVKKGENLADIAYKLFISDYMIMNINEDIDDYNDVEEGQVIKVPNAYARKTYLYIDQENYLPLIQIMYDEKGLFSKYEFHNLVLNPVIPPEEFTKDFEDYNF